MYTEHNLRIKKVCSIVYRHFYRLLLHFHQLYCDKHQFCIQSMLNTILAHIFAKIRTKNILSSHRRGGAKQMAILKVLL